MARLPSDGFLIQHIGDNVILFEDHTEREIVKFDPTSPPAIMEALKTIETSELSADDKRMAIFWSGYFFAHATL